jgi:hypothetical protein
MVRYSPRTGLPTEYQPGPYSAPHVYVQWGGKLPGSESWSCGFRMWKQAGTTEAELTPLMATISVALQAYHTSTTAYISGAAKLSFLKVNYIGLTGQYVFQTTNEQVYQDIPGGGGATAPYPNQVALAISLMTGYTRGPAHRGRFFMPLPMFALGTDGVISDSDRDYARGAAEAFRVAVNNNSTGHVMAVMSRKQGAANHRVVTGIQVGRVLDTQRRRRRSLVEDHQ